MENVDFKIGTGRQVSTFTIEVVDAIIKHSKERLCSFLAMS